MAYKLSDARSYWGQLSSELQGLSDLELKHAVEGKIKCRSQLQGIPDYRKRVAKWIRQEHVKTLLDFGCGVGGDGVWLSQKLGVKVTFADISPSNVELVKRYSKIWGIPTKAVHVDNSETFTFPESYDMIFADGVLHHISAAGKVVENLTRCLKPHGLFVCMLYTFKHYLDHEGHLGYAARSEANPNNPYSRCYSEKQAIELFKGFNLLDQWETYNQMFGWYVWRKKQ